MSQEPKKGWIGKVRVATTEGGLTTDEDNFLDASPSLDNQVEEAYHKGAREPQALMEGNIRLEVRIRRFFVNTTWLGYADSATELTEYYLRVYPLGSSVGKPYITYLGKFSGWNLENPQDGQIVEVMTFKGKAITIGTA